MSNKDSESDYEDNKYDFSEDYDDDGEGLYVGIPKIDPDTNPNLELWIAALHDKGKRIQYLLKKYPDININFQVDENYGIDHNCTYILLKGTTPLMVAIIRSTSKVVRLLIEHRAQINLQCSNGYTALHYAVQETSVECVELLLENNADTNIENTYGKTSYQMVIDRKSICYGSNKCQKENCDEKNHPFIIMKKLFDSYREVKSASKV